jgi:hypothetical protein
LVVDVGDKSRVDLGFMHHQAKVFVACLFAFKKKAMILRTLGVGVGFSLPVRQGLAPSASV